MIRTGKYIWCLVAVALVAVCSGCGYKFAESGTFPGGARSIFVTVFENRTGETGIENVFSNDMIFEFIRNGAPVAPDQGSADAVLHGTIKTASVSSVSHKDSHTSAERRVTVYVDVKLMDSKGGVIWSAVDISDNETYTVMSEKSATEQNLRAALSVVSKRIAEKLYYRLSDRF